MRDFPGDINIDLNVKAGKEGIPGPKPRLWVKFHPLKQKLNRHHRVVRPHEDGLHSGQGHRQTIPINKVHGVHQTVRQHRKHRMHGALPHPQSHRHLREDKK